MALSDPDRVHAQYQNASNLGPRITLHQRFSVNERPWHQWIFDQIKLPPDSRILELGCGTAALWTENRDRIPETWRMTLTDMSPGMLAAAEENINLNFRNTLTRNFTFMSTDAQGISFADGSFDAVVANHMLYHVADRTKAVSEVARVLKPGGVLYAATNGREHMREVDGCIRSLGPDHPEHGLARKPHCETV